MKRVILVKSLIGCKPNQKATAKSLVSLSPKIRHAITAADKKASPPKVGVPLFPICSFT